MSRLVVDKNFRLPVSQEIKNRAKKLSLLQPNAQKKQQVYLNILAVDAVNNYLNWMGYKTNIETSDSLNPIIQSVADIADLEIEGIGRVECIPVSSQTSIYQIPAEVWQERIGYIFVQIEDDYKEAVILGFTPNAAANVSLKDLKPLETLLEHLHRQNTPVSSIVPFREWLVDLVTTGWESLESLLQDAPIFAYRSQANYEKDLTWGKLINVGLTIQEQPLVLLITLNPNKASSLRINLRLQTLKSSQYIPEGLNISLLSQKQIVSQIESRQQDNALELGEFEGEIGEDFTVKIELDSFFFEETFII